MCYLPLKWDGEKAKHFGKNVLQYWPLVYIYDTNVCVLPLKRRRYTSPPCTCVWSAVESSCGRCRDATEPERQNAHVYTWRKKGNEATGGQDLRFRIGYILIYFVFYMCVTLYFYSTRSQRQIFFYLYSTTCVWQLDPFLFSESYVSSNLVIWGLRGPLCVETTPRTF